MPYPSKGESQQDYVSRSIPVIHKEHPDWTQKHIVGSAYGRYRYYRGHPSKNPSAGKNKKTLKDYAND